MDNIIKGFLGLFLLLFMLFLGLGILKASMDSRKADNFASDSARKIMNSNFSQTVINGCREDARKEGYELTVDLVRPREGHRPRYGTLTLKYQFRVPLLSFEKEQQLTEDLL